MSSYPTCSLIKPPEIDYSYKARIEAYHQNIIAHILKNESGAFITESGASYYCFLKSDDMSDIDSWSLFVTYTVDIGSKDAKFTHDTFNEKFFPHFLKIYQQLLAERIIEEVVLSEQQET